MPEPKDVTADDVQRFLKEVAKRTACPSCGTEEEPIFLKEIEMITSNPLESPNTKQITQEEPKRFLFEDENSSAFFEIRNQIYSFYGIRNHKYLLEPISVVCVNCGKIDSYALDRIQDWVRERVNG